jgi:hypothetical protein
MHSCVCLQYLFVDLITVLPLACFMSRTGPPDQLSSRLPTDSLVSSPILMSVLGQVGG